MIELIKKAVLTGVGVASLTKEKVEELSREIVIKGKMSEEEGEKFINEMVARAQQSKQALKDQTAMLIEKTLSTMQFAKSSEIEELRQEIDRLRAELEIMKKE